MELRFRLARRVIKTLPLQGMRLDLELDFSLNTFLGVIVNPMQTMNAEKMNQNAIARPDIEPRPHVGTNIPEILTPRSTARPS